MKIGYHTDAWNSSAWSFKQAVEWAAAAGLPYIECGSIDGVAWIHGLGYFPHVSLRDDPLALRVFMEERGVRFSQIDAAYPLSLPEGATIGVEYVLNTVRYAKLVGCPRVDTTDDRFRPEGMTDEEAIRHLKFCYREILKVAERYDIVINVEPHGYYTTKPDVVLEILSSFESSHLRLNMDTGNTFIAGQDPVAFLDGLKKYVNHVHVKDVSESLAASLRGEATGIAISHVAVGSGVNADNIVRCLGILKEIGYDGPLSLECEGSNGLIEQSLEWLTAKLAAHR